MKPQRYAFVGTICLSLALSRCLVAQETTPTALIVGEVRTLAIDVSNSQIATALHRTGWAEASGQTLSQSDFPELFRAIGRTWTADRVASDHFQLPNLHRTAETDIAAAIRGGLSCSDLITGGKALGRSHASALVQWIYVGRDATSLALASDSSTERPR